MTIANYDPTRPAAPPFYVARASLPEELQSRIRRYDPKTDLGRLVKAVLRFLPPAHAKELLDAIQRSVVGESALYLRIFRADADGRPWPLHVDQRDVRWPLPPAVLDARYGRGRHGWSRLEDVGLVSRKLVTNAGVDFIVDAFQNLTEAENLKFHGLGTGSTAEAATETALVTELTTQYNPDGTRATGSTTEVAGTPTKYRTVGTNTLDGAATIQGARRPLAGSRPRRHAARPLADRRADALGERRAASDLRPHADRGGLIRVGAEPTVDPDVVIEERRPGLVPQVADKRVFPELSLYRSLERVPELPLYPPPRTGCATRFARPAGRVCDLRTLDPSRSRVLRPRRDRGC